MSRHKVREHPVEVFGYACKNNYDDIANEAAPLTPDTDAKIMSKYLGPELMLL